jgi:Arabinose-binding domain of AraC transcription regulator, N-term
MVGCGRTKSWRPPRSYSASGGRSKEVSGDPTVGLRLGPNLSVDGGTPQTIAAVHSESFLDAIQRIARYKKLTCPEEIRLTRAGAAIHILFLCWTVANARYPVLVSWVFFFFLRSSQPHD